MSSPHWFIDELAHAGSEHLDPGYVPGYDTKSATDPIEDLAALQALGLNSTHILVDMGAGTGTFALATAPYCQRVIAVDVSSVMLAQLSVKLTDAGMTNVETVQRGFLSYEHSGELADFVYSRHALHHLPDFWKAIALTRIASFLKPGGILFLRDLVYSFEPARAEHTIEAWVAGGADRPEHGWTREELETHVREEYSTFSWLLEAIIERSGFTIQDARHRGSIYSTYVCKRI